MLQDEGTVALVDVTPPPSDLVVAAGHGSPAHAGRRALPARPAGPPAPGRRHDAARIGPATCCRRPVSRKISACRNSTWAPRSCGRCSSSCARATSSSWSIWATPLPTPRSRPSGSPTSSLLPVVADVPGLRRVRWALDTAESLGISRDRFQIVLNRYGGKNQVAKPKVEEALHTSILTTIADHGPLLTARPQRRPARGRVVRQRRLGLQRPGEDHPSTTWRECRHEFRLLIPRAQHGARRRRRFRGPLPEAEDATPPRVARFDRPLADRHDERRPVAAARGQPLAAPLP